MTKTWWIILALLGGIAVGVGAMVMMNPQIAYQNEETWEWKDWKGRERKITVHRNVKRDV